MFPMRSEAAPWPQVTRPWGESPRLHKARTISALTFFFFFCVTLFTGLRRSLNIELSDTSVRVSRIRARPGTTAHSPFYICIRLDRNDHSFYPIPWLVETNSPLPADQWLKFQA